MITVDNNKDSLKCCCTEGLKKAEISALVHLLLKNQKETDDNVHSLQKSVAGLHEQVEDFRVEHAEDNAEVKRILHELRRNKVWVSRERL